MPQLWSLALLLKQAERYRPYRGRVGHPSTENKSDRINLSETLHLTQPQKQQNILRKGSTMAGELKTSVSCTTMRCINIYVPPNL